MKVDIDSIIKLYVEDKKSMQDISKELGIAVGTVYNHLHKHGIKTRDISEATKGKKLSEEHKKAISKRHKGKIVPKEVRQKISESHKKGGVGHKKIRCDGYVSVYFPDHPKSSSDGYVMEHVLVMECLVGRWLKDDEVVHHKNGNRHDNKKENLQLMTKSEHMSFHMKERHKKKGGMTY